MKIATWNINSLAVRLPHLLEWLAAHPVDVICLQELKLTDDKFPADALKEAGYQVQCFGQKTYNGVAILSREPVTDVERNILGHDDPQARVIAGSIGGLRVIGAYVPNGQEPGSEKYQYKMQWLSALRRWMQGELAKYPQLVLMGDFNIAPADADVHNPALWDGKIMCTGEEREHFRELLMLGLHDSFRMFEQPPKSFTWWDYRMLGFQKNKGLRIDHILVSNALEKSVVSCSIDRAPRKKERPSDHAPVLAEIAGF